MDEASDLIEFILPEEGRSVVLPIQSDTVLLHAKVD